MQFAKLNEHNIKSLYPFLYSCDYRLCDYTPCVLLLWGNYFHYYFAVQDNVLFIRQKRKGITEFLLPITKPENLENALLFLKQYCEQQSIDLRIVAIPEQYKQMVEQTLNTQANDMGEDEADYAYDASDLKTLTGRRYNSKRNHVNRFKKDYPQACFKKLCTQDIPQLLEFLEHYHKTVDSATYNYDRTAVEHFVKEFDKFEFLGGAIQLDGKIVALSFGDKIGDTLVVHIEKALRDISGLYETMTHSFISEYADDTIKYINREEDMGDLGLRAAKLSYHPQIWRKYFIQL